MGGRKGYSLSTVVGPLRPIKKPEKELLRAIEIQDPKKVVAFSAKIIAKSDLALDSIGYGYLFMDSISDDYKRLRAQSTKERRKEIAKRWALFRKERGKTFDARVNRDVVDSATRVLGGEEDE